MNTRKKIVGAVAACGLAAALGGCAYAGAEGGDPNVPPAVVDSQSDSPDGSRRVVAHDGDGERNVTYVDPPSEEPDDRNVPVPVSVMDCVDPQEKAFAPCEEATTTMTESDGPVLQSVSPVTPDTVDVTAAAALFTVDVHVTSPAGLLGGDVEFLANSVPASPCRTTLCSGGGLDPSSRLSGTALDGVYRVQMPMFQFAKAGTWCLASVRLSDVAGNSRDYHGSSLDPFKTCFEVISDEDLDGPVLRSVGPVTPSTVDVSSGAALFTVDVHVTDAPAGLAGGTVVFVSPLSGDVVQTTKGGGIDPSSPLRGSRFDGVYRVRMSVPRFARTGTWCLDSINVGDVAGNFGDYRGPSIAPFKTCVEVVSDEGGGSAPTTSTSEVAISPDSLDKHVEPSEPQAMASASVALSSLNRPRQLPATGSDLGTWAVMGAIMASMGIVMVMVRRE